MCPYLAIVVSRLVDVCTLVFSNILFASLTSSGLTIRWVLHLGYIQNQVVTSCHHWWNVTSLPVAVASSANHTCLAFGSASLSLSAVLWPKHTLPLPIGWLNQSPPHLQWWVWLETDIYYCLVWWKLQGMWLGCYGEQLVCWQHWRHLNHLSCTSIERWRHGVTSSTKLETNTKFDFRMARSAAPSQKRTRHSDSSSRISV